MSTLKFHGRMALQPELIYSKNNDRDMKKTFSLLGYKPKNIITCESDDVEVLISTIDACQKVWITVNGHLSADVSALDKLLAHFSITSVTAAQLRSGNLFDFIGEHADCMYTEFAIPYNEDPAGQASQLHGNVILGENFLITLSATATTIFDAIQERLLKDESPARHYGADYLFYLAMRSLVTRTENTLFSEMVKKFEILEDEVIASSGEPYILDKILAIREQLKPVYESVRSLTVFINTIMDDDESIFIGEQTNLNITKKLKQDVTMLWESHARLHNWVNELMNIHRTNVNERTSRIMHILTIVSTIFLPITFLASLYGMNFVNMPFLKNPNGYAITLFVMLSIIVSMTLFMKWKKWF